MNVASSLIVNIEALNTMVRDVLDVATFGVSVNDNGSTIHLTDASLANQDKATAILDGWGGLAIVASVSSMNEGDADPTVTCNDTLIASDANLGYIVLLDGEIYASGQTPVTAGSATLTLVSPVDGVYDIWMYRLVGNYASQSVRIVVNEV